MSSQTLTELPSFYVIDTDTHSKKGAVVARLPESARNGERITFGQMLVGYVSRQAPLGQAKREVISRSN